MAGTALRAIADLARCDLVEVAAQVLTRDDVLRMPEIDIEIPVADFYADIAFPEDDPASN